MSAHDQKIMLKRYKIQILQLLDQKETNIKWCYKCKINFDLLDHRVNVILDGVKTLQQRKF